MLKRHSPTTANTDFHDFLGELEEAGATQKEGQTDWLDNLANSAEGEDKSRAFSIQRAGDAREKIRFRKSSDGGTGVRIWAGRSVDSPVKIEHDFTTPGTAGRLGCPFAASAFGIDGRGRSRGVSTPGSSRSKGSIGRRSKRASFHDPIRAEACAFAQKPPDPSLQGSQPLCPIRFMDQHSPEEVAKYFENHKHELPRSHQFCVTRFQENEDSLRNLDSKYANVVSMVKELGKVHQPIFPQAEDVAVEDAEEEPHNPDSKVESWAKDVQNSDADEADEKKTAPREQRFDRPLSDIRVGESPSRPWGIRLPADYEDHGDAKSKKSDRTASPFEPEAQESRAIPLACPFSGAPVMDPAPPQEPPSTKPPETPDEPSKDPHPKPLETPRIVFNGPVFFGYGPDQVMTFMNQFGQSL